MSPLFLESLFVYFPAPFCDFKHILAGPATSLLGLVLAVVGGFLLELEEWVGILAPPPDNLTISFLFWLVLLCLGFVLDKSLSLLFSEPFPEIVCLELDLISLILNPLI